MARAIFGANGGGMGREAQVIATIEELDEQIDNWNTDGYHGAPVMVTLGYPGMNRTGESSNIQT